MGAAAAQVLAATRPGARAAVLLHGALPLAATGGSWPSGVPVALHHGQADPLLDARAIDRLVAELRAHNVEVELFTYSPIHLSGCRTSLHRSRPPGLPRAQRGPPVAARDELPRCQGQRSRSSSPNAQATSWLPPGCIGCSRVWPAAAIYPSSDMLMRGGHGARRRDGRQRRSVARGCAHPGGARRSPRRQSL